MQTPRSSSSGSLVVHRGGGEPQSIECSDQVDPQNRLERHQLMRATFGRCALRPAHAGAADADAQARGRLGGSRNRGLHLGLVADVAGNELSALPELRRQRHSLVSVDVGDRDAGAAWSAARVRSPHPTRTRRRRRALPIPRSSRRGAYQPAFRCVYAHDRWLQASPSTSGWTASSHHVRRRRQAVMTTARATARRRAPATGATSRPRC